MLAVLPVLELAVNYRHLQFFSEMILIFFMSVSFFFSLLYTQLGNVQIEMNSTKNKNGKRT